MSNWGVVMGLLSKDQILNADDRKHIDVEVPEWGGTVRIAILSGIDRENLEREFANLSEGERSKYSVRAFMVALSVVDENGNRLFTKKDMEQLNKKSWRALELIQSRVSELNGIGDAQVEKLAKN